MAKHYVEVSDEVWKELVRIQKKYKIDKHALVDDIIALAGDLEAAAEAHEDSPKTVTDPLLNTEPLFSDTQAAVLQPSADELSELI